MAAAVIRPLRPVPGRGVVRSRWMAARAAAVLSMAAAWVHLAFVESHWAAWWAYGVTFLAMGVGQALFVPVILHKASTWVVAVGIAGNLAIITMYVWSRTAGIPLGPHKGVAERASLIGRQAGIREHRILAPVDQRAGLGREELWLSVRKQTVVPWRRFVDEHVVAEDLGRVHGASALPLSRASLPEERVDVAAG